MFRLLELRVVDFLLVLDLTELFFLGVTAMRRYERIENRRFASGWISIRRIFAQKGTSPTNHLYTDKYI